MKFFKIVINLFLAMFLGAAIGTAFQINPLYPTLGIVLASFIPKSIPQGVAMMGIEKEIWTNDIIKNLFKANHFLQYAKNADSYVVGGKIVHIPVSGSKPDVVKNRTNLPASIVKRADGEVVYVLDEFTTNPILIENAETIELSYDKRADILSDHQEVLNEDVADWMLRNWASYTHDGVTDVATQIRTSGAGASATADDATGNRKIFLKEDLKRAKKLMNKNNIPKENRYALFDSEMIDQLHDDDDLKKRDSSMELDMKNGVIDRLYGFKIMERSSVLTFSNAATPVVKDPGANTAASDNSAVLCWHQNSVERAKGTVKFFENLDVPEYYGDIYSALLRMGGRIRRKEGIVAIVQEHA